MSGEERVQVAVRLRPFNDREKARNAQLIINMTGNTTVIVDPNQKSAEKKFTFDFSYWSHDGYQEREDGYLEPVEPKYADQARVFEDLGKGVLANAWQGFNCSLFAYGQTGSGKSYSMVGYNANKGIIPITCERLFEGIEEKKATDDKAKEAEYQVSVSMLEIYNENVKDLLNPASFKKGALRVREHPQKGFFVDGLKIFPVSNYAGIEGRIAEGTRNRTVAATNMNATSSRAHTIVAITFAQKSLNDAGQNMTKTSIINLVDLAGSERAESTGNTGERLREGANINQSLSCLGNCIKALADQQVGQTVSIPFRNSTLTRLLKNALGGNSKTIMIAALSPADINYAETLSTLRFADRAKSIKTKAIVNESPTDKLIREMKSEIERLQELLKAQAAGTVVVQGISPEEVEEMRKNQEAELQRNQEEMDQMNLTWQQRLDEEQQKSLEALEKERAKQEARKTIPNLWNLNEDPMLSGMIVHLSPPGSMKIGSVEPADIVVKGLGIQKEHAILENQENSMVCISAINDCPVLVNGKTVKEKTVLHHNDRIMFGSSQLYVLHHPQDAAIQEKEGKLIEKVSFDSAQEEIAQNKGFDMSGKSQDELILQEELIQIMPIVNEANAMSEELDQKMVYDIALLTPEARGLKDGKTEVFIRAKNLVSENEYLLEKGEFEVRKFGMQEMYEDFVEGEEDWNKEEADGFPFKVSDSNGVLIGVGYLFLHSLAYLMDLEDNITVQDYRGIEIGLLSVKALPFSDKGNLLVDEDIDDPQELIGKNVRFEISLNKLLDIPKRYVKTWCRYKFFLQDDWTESDRVSGSMNFTFNQKWNYNIFPVTTQMVNELENSFLMVQVFAEQNSEPNDLTRAERTTRELLLKEASVTLYKSDSQPGVKNKGVHGNKELRRRDSEINNLHNAINTNQTALTKAERENASLREENATNQLLMQEMQQKLALIENMVQEAQRKGEQTLLVARLDHILRTGRDLEPDDISTLNANLISTTSQQPPFPHPPPPVSPAMNSSGSVRDPSYFLPVSSPPYRPASSTLSSSSSNDASSKPFPTDIRRKAKNRPASSAKSHSTTEKSNKSKKKKSTVCALL